MLGLEEFFDGLINEAKSPEEIRRTLEYQFVKGKGVPPDLLNDAMAEDPTSKKTYTRWLFSKWDDEKDLIEEIIKNGDLKRLFDYFKSRQNNGLNLSAFKTVDSAVGMLPEVDRVLKKNGNDGPEDDYDIVYDEPDWKIAVPHTYEASKKLGKGCRWCTAGGFGDTDSYFNDYTRRGTLWINFKMGEKELGPKDNKEYPYTRYQFCFETDDFRDSNDGEIESFEAIGLPEDVRDFYAGENEEYGKVIDENRFGVSEERYNQDRENDATFIKDYEGHTLCIMQAWNDDYELYAYGDYYVYDKATDTSDPITFVTVQNDVRTIVKNYDNSSVIILVSNESSYLIYYKDANKPYYECCTTKNDNYETVFYDDNIVVASVGDDDCIFINFVKKEKTFYTNNEGMSIDGFKVLKGLPIKDKYGKFYDANSYYITIDYQGEYKGLIKINSEKFSPETIVAYDNPANNDYFEVEYIDGLAYLITENYRYCLDDNMDSEKNKYTFDEDINGKYIIVKSKNNYDLKNVYNKETQKILLDIPAGKIIPSSFIDLNYLEDPDYNKLDQLIVSDYNNRNAYIFDLATEKQISHVYEYYEIVYYSTYFPRYVFFYENNKNTTKIYLVNGLKLEPLGKFDSIDIKDVMHGIIVTAPNNNEVVNVYDIDGTLLFDNVIILKGGSYQKNSSLLLLKKQDTGDTFLFDKRNKTILVNNIQIKEQCGKYFSFSTNGGKDFFMNEDDFYSERPHIRSFDKIIKINTYGSVAVIENGRLYFANLEHNIDREPGPKGGIDPSMVATIEAAFGHGDNFGVTAVNGERFLCSPEYQSFTRVSDNKRVGSNPFETKLDEIRRNFNSLLDKINTHL